jgi:LuxR family maltose regulon positive regulatory protein
LPTTDDRRPTAWVSLTSAENDPAALLSYIAVALDEIEPVEPGWVVPLWGSAVTVGSAAVQRFVAMFATRDRPFVLVLDDVHELSSEAVLDTVAALVRELPPGSTMVLGSRRHLPLP